MEGYLNIGYQWWLITPNKEFSTNIRDVNTNGLIDSANPSLDKRSVRPSINLKPEVIITGEDGITPKTVYTIALP